MDKLSSLSVVVQGEKDEQARRLPVAYLTLPPQFKVAIPNKLLRTGRRKKKCHAQESISNQANPRETRGRPKSGKFTYNPNQTNKHHTYDVYVCACFLAHAHAHRRKEIQELGFFFFFLIR